MQNLRETDGTPIHRKAIRTHIAKCRAGGAPLHAQLRTEATVFYDDLKAKERAHEEAEDDVVDAVAGAEVAEVGFENAIRDLDNDLQRFDRDHPGVNARSKVFPDGFGAVIEPEGDKQIEELPKLHARAEPFKNEAVLSASFTKVDVAEEALKTALGAVDTATDAEETAFALELAARAAVRAQLTSAHGRLRDLYKSRPARAEEFFMKFGRKQGTSKAPLKTEATGPAGGGEKAPQG